MTAYLLTEDLRNDLIGSLETTCGRRCNPEYNPCWAYELADKLKAMKPQTPVAWMIDGDYATTMEHYAASFRRESRVVEPLYTLGDTA